MEVQQQRSSSSHHVAVTIVNHDRTTESNEGSTPPNGIEAGKRTTESNQGSNPCIRNPKSEIRNPQFE